MSGSAMCKTVKKQMVDGKAGHTAALVVQGGIFAAALPMQYSGRCLLTIVTDWHCLAHGTATLIYKPEKGE